MPSCFAWVVIIPVLSAGIVPGEACACAVPVYRYALERDSWHPAPYGILLFHSGELSKEQEEFIESIRAMNDYYTTGMPVNVDALSVNVDKMDEISEEVRAVWDSLDDQTLPRMVVCHPRIHYGQELTVAWSGEPSEAVFRRLIDSPARRDIVRKMASGQAGVFVLVESGDREVDDKAAALVQKALDQFAEEFELPPYAKEAMGIPPEEEVEVTFSLLRIARDDPDEKGLMDIIDIGIPETADDRKEPLLSAVFGRGRILPFLVGEEISEDGVFYYLGYLSGNCSCEIKLQNPGFDLLMRSNWYKVLAGEVPPPLPRTVRNVVATEVPTESADVEASAAAAAEATEPTAAAAPTESGSPLLRNLLIAAGSVLALVVGLTVVLMRRAGKEAA
jgi:hypothetical protein